MKTIFVSGVHGAGKTKLSQDIADYLNCEYYSCSDLIKKELISHGREVNWDNEKKVDGVEENQSLLIDAVRKLKQDKYIVLDGHFTLIENEEYVPTLTKKDIEKLNIILNVYIDIPANQIIENMSKRDGVKHSLKTIEGLIASENEIRTNLLNGIPTIDVNEFEITEYL